jgi:uncharacterized membrane protein
MSDAGDPARRDRSLAALAAAGVAGVCVLVGLIAAGLVLYQRVFGDSWIALVVILAVFGGLGAYLAWLVGVLIYSAMRSPEGEEIG